MFVAENIVEIARPPAEVFAFVTDPRNIPKWRPIALEVLNVPDTIGVGSTYELIEQMMGRHRFGQRVLEHQPDRLHVLETLDGPVRPIQRYTLEPAAGGGTRLRARLEVRTYGFMRLFEPFMRGQVRKTMVEYGDNLKRAIEGRA